MTNDNYTGVTTGTIATACSLAALDAILDFEDIACVKVETPKKTLDIIIIRIFMGNSICLQRR